MIVQEGDPIFLQGNGNLTGSQGWCHTKNNTVVGYNNIQKHAAHALTRNMRANNKITLLRSLHCEPKHHSTWLVLGSGTWCWYDTTGRIARPVPPTVCTNQSENGSRVKLRMIAEEKTHFLPLLIITLCKHIDCVQCKEY